MAATIFQCSEGTCRKIAEVPKADIGVSFVLNYIGQMKPDKVSNPGAGIFILQKHGKKPMLFFVYNEEYFEP